MQAPPVPWLLAFLTKWAPIVAPVALVQPWIIALVKRLFMRGRVDAYEAAWVELGFSSFGPTIGVMGTLRATHRDQFVHQIDLTVTRLKDGATHDFKWLGFRAERVTSSSGPELSFELAAGFLIPTTQPHRYSILFNDAESQNDMRAHLINLRQGWEPLELALARGPQTDSPAAVTKVLQLPEPLRLQQLYTDFSSEKVHIDAFAAIGRILYWEPGDYVIQMNVRVARPHRVFTTQWRVQLGADDAERLRLNVIPILRETLGQSVSFNFAYLPYLPEWGDETP